MSQSQPESSAHRAEQIRSDIDSGRTGEKVAYPDPAMAPLGTDDEAAGTPLTNRQAEMEVAARPQNHKERRPSLTLPLFLGGIVAVAVALLAIVFFGGGT